jgi:hypothetical protein
MEACELSRPSETIGQIAPLVPLVYGRAAESRSPMKADFNRFRDFDRDAKCKERRFDWLWLK